MNKNTSDSNMIYDDLGPVMTFASLTGRAGQPMDFDGDFDDHYTAEDYERRQYQRDARDYGYSSWDRCGR
jgi:hypothetical protein|tara:strand:+ start:1468 stop:1677 length:210 start_codon:yes stop_codon:yes gene_type:complete